MRPHERDRAVKPDPTPLLINQGNEFTDIYVGTRRVAHVPDESMRLMPDVVDAYMRKRGW